MTGMFAKRNPPLRINSEHLRMARFPAGSELLFTEGLWVPIVVTKNVYILPGIPWLFSKMLDANKDRFRDGKMGGFARKLIYTKLGESHFSQQLREISQIYGGRISIGSYPQEGYCKVSVEGVEGAVVERAAAEIREAIEGYEVEERDIE
eukprot:TRINITY_DN12411_c0_g1_i1.p2 TRINITY_DN12411_c0_g1~~TRINITY_DN12411_c0_g1_i1.p2  ORF type:complete len:150 (-),score=36.41 TRINITY_DN12411_c0_g1_i1:54-503(-)